MADFSASLHRDAQLIKTAAEYIGDEWVNKIQLAKSEAAARAVDAILDTIGVENIKMFLPCWEASGTKLYDLLDRNLTFDLYGPTLAVSSPFGGAVSFDGVNDYAKQAPITEAQGGGSYENLDSGTKRIAQKLVQFSEKVLCVRLKLKKVGAPVGTLQVDIVQDNAGQPTGTVIASSATIDVANVQTSDHTVGFYFSTAPYLCKGVSYWVVLKWATSTTVDASNYIQVVYDATGAYGQPRAVYDGTAWTVVTGQSHWLEVYNTKLWLNGDFSIIVLATATTAGIQTILQCYKDPFGYGVFLRHNAADLPKASVEWYISKIGLGNPLYQTTLSGYHVFGLTLSQAASTDKAKVYLDGRLFTTASGTAGATLDTFGGPFVLGAYELNTSGLYGYGLTKIACVIVTKNVLTDAQMAKVAHYLLPQRKRWGVE